MQGDTSKRDFAADLDTNVPWADIVRNPPTGVPLVEVFGDFPEDVITITRTMMSLLIGVGTNDATRESVLLPYIEARFGGSDVIDEEEDDGSTAIFSEILTYENAAFWIANLAYDIRGIAKDLKEATSGQTKLERARLDVARFYMALTTQQALTCSKLLHDIVERLPGETDEALLSAPNAESKPTKKALRRPPKARL